MPPAGRPKTFRVRGVAYDLTPNDLKVLLYSHYSSLPRGSISIRSLAPSVDDENRPATQVATVEFRQVPETLQGQDECSEIIATKSGRLSIDNHFMGFTPLNRVEKCNYKINCIAISGLASHPFGSWRQRVNDRPEADSQFMWLRDALPQDVPESRVVLYGYDTDLRARLSEKRVDDLALGFKNHLKRLQRRSTRPYILLAHSLGGLVVKKALCLLDQSGSELDQKTLKALHKILCFGVPNRGMKIEHLRAMVENTPEEGLVNQLSENDKFAEGLDDAFTVVIQKYGKDVVSFYETRHSPTVKKVDGRWQLKGPPELLVDTKSAIQKCSGPRSHPIDKDHSNMVKFGWGDPDYLVVREHIEQSPSAYECISSLIFDWTRRWTTRTGSEPPRTLSVYSKSSASHHEHVENVKNSELRLDFAVIFLDFLNVDPGVALPSYPSFIEENASQVEILAIPGIDGDKVLKRRQIQVTSQKPASPGQTVFEYWLPQDGVRVQQTDGLIIVRFSDGRQKEDFWSNGCHRYTCSYNAERPNVQLGLRISDPVLRENIFNSLLLRDAPLTVFKCRVEPTEPSDMYECEVSIQQSPLTTQILDTVQKYPTIILWRFGDETRAEVLYVRKFIDFEIEARADPWSLTLNRLAKLEYETDSRDRTPWPPQFVRENKRGHPEKIRIDHSIDLHMKFESCLGLTDEQVRNTFLQQLTGWNLRECVQTRKHSSRLGLGYKSDVQITLWQRDGEIRLLGREYGEPVSWFSMTLVRKAAERITTVLTPTLKRDEGSGKMKLKGCRILRGDCILLADFRAHTENGSRDTKAEDLILSFESSRAAEEFCRLLKSLAEIYEESS